MTDVFLYECTDCRSLIRDGYQPIDRECPVCGGAEFDRREQIR